MYTDHMKDKSSVKDIETYLEKIN